MDATDTAPDGATADERPAVALRHLVDDRTDPSELTIFAPQNLTTEWLTADRSAAVPLDQIR
jgi:hypothetical protein